jgi:hypothetical protein
MLLTSQSAKVSTQTRLLQPKICSLPLDDLVDETVGECLTSHHELVAFGIELHLLKLLARVLRDEFIEEILRTDNVFRVNRDIRRLAFRTTERLVNHDLGMREREALALGATHENHGTAGSRHTKTHCGDIGLHVLHRVVHGERGRHLTAGGIDVEDHIFLGILLFKEEELSDDGIGDIVIDRRTKEDDALFEQAGIYVVHALTKLRLFDNRRHDEVLDRTGATQVLSNGLDSGIHEEERKGNEDRRGVNVPGAISFPIILAKFGLSSQYAKVFLSVLLG